MQKNLFRQFLILGSYNYLEHYLQKLAFISECTPRANKKYLSTETPKMNLPSSAIEDVFEKSEETPKESPDEPKEEKKSLTEKASELIYNGIFGKSKMAKGKYHIQLPIYLFSAV